MGTNILDEVEGGVVRENHVNQFYKALTNDLVPRNAIGVPEGDGDATLGDSNFNFSKVYIGDAANNVDISEDSNDLVVNVDGEELLRIGDATISSTPGRNGFALSSSCGVFSTTSTSFVNVTNLEVTLNVSGLRPVILQLVPDESASANWVGYGENVFTFTRDTIASNHEIQLETPAPGALFAITPGCLFFFDDSKSSGSITYRIQTRIITGTSRVNNCKLLVMEI